MARDGRYTGYPKPWGEDGNKTMVRLLLSDTQLKQLNDLTYLSGLTKSELLRRLIELAWLDADEGYLNSFLLEERTYDT